MSKHTGVPTDAAFDESPGRYGESYPENPEIVNCWITHEDGSAEELYGEDITEIHKLVFDDTKDFHINADDWIPMNPDTVEEYFGKR